MRFKYSNESPPFFLLPPPFLKADYYDDYDNAVRWGSHLKNLKLKNKRKRAKRKNYFEKKKDMEQMRVKLLPLANLIKLVLQLEI